MKTGVLNIPAPVRMTPSPPRDRENDILERQVLCKSSSCYEDRGSSLVYTNLPLYAQLQWVIQLVIRFRHRNQKSWTMIRSVPPPIGGALTIHWSGRRSCDSITSPVAMAHEAPGLAMRNRQVTVGFKLWLKPIFLLNMSNQQLFLWPCQNIYKKTFWA